MERRDRDNRGAPQGPRTDAGNRGRVPGNGNVQPRPNNPQAPRLASYEDPNAYRSPGFQDWNQTGYRIDYAGLPKDDDEAADAQPQVAPQAAPIDAQPLDADSRGNTAAGHAGQSRGGFLFTRGTNGRRPDRSGTDPNAYRSPGFREELSKSRRPGGPSNNGGPSMGPRQGPRDARPAPTNREAPPANRDAAQAPREGAPSRRERSARLRVETTCQACGAAAVVPFQPAPDRPAFCKPCYETKKIELGLGPGKRPPAAEMPTAETHAAETPTAETPPEGAA